MKHERVLGILILSEWILGILINVSDSTLEPFLPASLRAYLATDEAAAFVGGAILWIVYFSELRTRFRRLSEAVGAAKENAA